MTTSGCLTPMTCEHRPIVERLWQLYAHDLSEFRGSMPGGNGCYKAGRLPTYFEDPDRCGYLIMSGSSPAGFAMIRGLSQRRVATDAVGDTWSEERRPVPNQPELPPDVWLQLRS